VPRRRDRTSVGGPRGLEELVQGLSRQGWWWWQCHILIPTPLFFSPTWPEHFLRYMRFYILDRISRKDPPQAFFFGRKVGLGSYKSKSITGLLDSCSSSCPKRSEELIQRAQSGVGLDEPSSTDPVPPRLSDQRRVTTSRGPSHPSLWP
jgi:hypothetical protein